VVVLGSLGRKSFSLTPGEENNWAGEEQKGGAGRGLVCDRREPSSGHLQQVWKSPTHGLIIGGAGPSPW
jgi:hypothetical protein